MTTSASVKQARELVVGDYINVDGSGYEVRYVGEESIGHVLITWSAGGAVLKAKQFRADSLIEYVPGEGIS